MSVALTINGPKAIAKAFRSLPKKLAKKVVRQAVRKALKPMLKAARSNAPVGTTGRLKKAIKIKTGKRKKGTMRINVSVGDKDFQGATFYGAMVNYGTKKQRAQKFMNRAFEANSRAVATSIENEIVLGIEREVK